MILSVVSGSVDGDGGGVDVDVDVGGGVIAW